MESTIVKHVMTDEERRARHNHRQRVHRAKHSVAYNERQRKRRAENKERYRAYARAYYERNREACQARARKWQQEHVDERRAKDRARKHSPERIAKMRRDIETRRQRTKTDPEYRAKLAEQQKRYRQKLHAQGRYAAFSRKTYLIPKWNKVVEQGQKRIAAYLRLARPENRRQFMTWYTQKAGLLNRTTGLGRIEVRDEDQM